MLRRSEIHYLSNREVKIEIPANNFSHLHLATQKLSRMDIEKGGIP